MRVGKTLKGGKEFELGNGGERRSGRVGRKNYNGHYLSVIRHLEVLFFLDLMAIISNHDLPCQTRAHY